MPPADRIHGYALRLKAEPVRVRLNYTLVAFVIGVALGALEMIFAR
jgi:hypothetical protein